MGTEQTPVYQDLSARKSRNVPLWLLVHALIGLLKKKNIVNLPITLKENSKRISDNLMNLLGTQNKDISALQRRRYLPGLDRVCDAGYVTSK